MVVENHSKARYRSAAEQAGIAVSTAPVSRCLLQRRHRTRSGSIPRPTRDRVASAVVTVRFSVGRCRQAQTRADELTVPCSAINPNTSDQCVTGRFCSHERHDMRAWIRSTVERVCKANQFSASLDSFCLAERSVSSGEVQGKCCQRGGSGIRDPQRRSHQSDT